MTEYSRGPQVVWRQGPDRVLVRRLGGEALDLMGAAAMVWLALDSRQTMAQLADELSGFGVDSSVVASTLDDLVGRGLLETAC